MSRGLKLYFLILTPWALCATLFPASILIGIVGGVVPGIILVIAPFLLLYSLLWLPLRSALRWLADIAGQSRGWTARGIAIDVFSALIVGAAVIAVPKALNQWVDAKIVELQRNDRLIVGPVRLPDRVTLRLPAEAIEERITCETLCQRLLYNYAVRTVLVIGPGEKVIGFMLQNGADCPQPRLSRGSVRWRNDGAGDRVLDRVKKRIAGGECLVAFRPRTNQGDLAITVAGDWDQVFDYPITWNLFAAPVKTSYVEITSASGETLFRSTQVDIWPLMVPLLAQAGGWARIKSTHNDIGLYGREVLPSVLGEEASRLPDGTSMRL